MTSVLDWWQSDPHVQFKMLGLDHPPDTSIAYDIFLNLTPVLIWMNNKSKDEVDFWKLISSSLKKILSVQTDPVADFENFVNILYSNRNLLNPRTPVDYSFLINQYYERPISNFLFISFSKLFKDQNAFILFLSYLHDSNSVVYNMLLNENGGIEKLYDFFVSLLYPPYPEMTSDQLNVRLHFVELLVSSVINSPRTFVNQNEFYSSIFRSISRLILMLNPSKAIPFIRLIIIFLKGIINNVPQEFLYKPIQTLLSLADPSSPGYGIISTFVCSLCPNHIYVEDLVPILSAQYFASPMEFHNIFMRCNTQYEGEILLGVKIFSRIMVLSFYWSRISAYYLSILLQKGRYYDKVQEWFSNFLLQLKASTIIQENERKYVSRRRRLKEIFTSSLFSEFVVVSDLFDISEYDEIIPAISEIEKMISMEELKYLPFHPKGLDLITNTKKKHRKKKKRSKSVPHSQPSTPNKDAESSEELNPKPKKKVKKRRKKNND